MRRVRLAVMVIGVVFVLSGVIRGAEALDEVFRRVDGGGWGSNQRAIKRAIGGGLALEKPTILVLPSSIAGRPATINYLFNQRGRMYNQAWYATFTLDEFAEALTFDEQLVAELTVRYGAPAYSFSDGDPAKLEEAKKDAASIKDSMDRFRALMEARHNQGPPTREELKTLFPDGNPAPKTFLPSIFHSRMSFWNAGKIWAYTNLLCSTGGYCRLHLQFIDKRLTEREGYQPTPDKLFSYSPLDRDQDLVTAANSEAELKLKKP